jgi:short-subunit dehydrogenase
MTEYSSAALKTQTLTIIQAQAGLFSGLTMRLFGMNADTALITGASSGIGLHLAREFAAHGHPVVLVARQETELRKIGDDLAETHGIPVWIISKDLECPNSCEEIFDEVRALKITVDILVNDAGLGQLGNFWETPLDRDLAMLHVNLEAVVRLTKLFLPSMIERRRGRILNVASVAGFEPGPRLAVYHATKAFVLSFSEALATELEGTGVILTALCPGPTDTDFFTKAAMTETRAFQKMKVMAPQEVAEAGYNGLRDGDRLVVPGLANKAQVFSRRLMSTSAQAKLNQKFYESVPPEDRKRQRGEMESESEIKSPRPI